MKCHDLHHTGRSTKGTANISYTEIWRYEFDDSLDTDPAIGDDGTIYIGSGDRYLYAFYPNGTVKWRYDVGGRLWLKCPAIADDGTIYIGVWSGSLHAINPDGTLKWTFGSDMGSDPVIGEDGTIYFGTFEGAWTDAKIVAVNPNGTEKWNYPTGFHTTSDPSIGDDGTIYIGSGDTYLYALYPNGTLRWKFKTGDYIKAPSSIAEDGTIFVCSYDDYLYAINPNGTLRWKKNPSWHGSDSNPSIGPDGNLYVGWGGNIFAFNPDDGEIIWGAGTGGSTGDSSPAICADGIIYVGVGIGDWDGGDILALNSDGTERWRKRLSTKRVRSSPAIADDGTVYISTTSGEKSNLHAFGIGPLIVDAGGPYSGYAGSEIQFTGTIFGGIPPYTYHWDFGDDGTSDEQNPTHIYSDIGEYTAIFSVIDSEGNYSSDNASVTIDYPPPTVSIIKPKKALYFMNLMIRLYLSDRKPLICGLINVKAGATNDYLDIERVEFFINNELVKTDETWPYNWLWQGSGSLEDIHKIKVIAYDSEGKSASDSIQVRKLF
jgi:outer membrane protein assembly factor BamB